MHHSDNQEWKINYAMITADSDALSCDIVPQAVHHQAVADFGAQKALQVQMLMAAVTQKTVD